MEKKKVYVVTEGDYSDYHILAVFSTKEQAEKYANSRHGVYAWRLPEHEKAGIPLEQITEDMLDEQARVEEYELDVPIQRMAYQVVMDLSNGNVLVVQPYEMCAEGKANPLEEDVWERGPNEYRSSYNNTVDVEYRIHIFAKDREHAVKVANEYRLRYKAAQTGGGGNE